MPHGLHATCRLCHSFLILLVESDICSCVIRQMVVRSLHEVVQQVVDFQGDIARALCAAEQFSHDSGCAAVLFLIVICFDIDTNIFSFFAPLSPQLAW